MKLKDLPLFPKIRGSKVHYKDPNTGKIENGIIQTFVPKEDTSEEVTEVNVVYHCGGNWDKYYNYTAARTKLEHLNPGWFKKLNFKIKSQL